MSIYAADVDSDSHLDLITANGLTDSVSVLLNKGDGSFTPHMDYEVHEWPEQIFAGDFDGDGDVDLAAPHLLGVSVLLNNGDGTFAPYSWYPVVPDTTNSAMSVFVADLDGDGDVDLATGNHGSVVSVLLNQTALVCGDCNGDGRITVADAIYIVSYIYREGPPMVCECDVNVDTRITVADAIYIVSYIYRGGPSPCQPPVASPARQNRQAER